MSGILNISASGRVTCVVPIDLFPAVAMAAEPEPETSSSCDCEVLKAWQTSEVIMRRLNQSMIVYLPSDAKKIKREHLGENVDLLAPILQNLGSSVDPLKFPLLVLTMPSTPITLPPTVPRSPPFCEHLGRVLQEALHVEPAHASPNAYKQFGLIDRT